MDQNQDDHEVVDTRSKKFRLSNAMEIPFLLIVFGDAITGTSMSNLIMYRTCVNELNHTSAECKPFLWPDKMNFTPAEKKHMKGLETEVQEYVNFLMTVKTILESLVPAILSLFIGAWSDKHGRKPLVVWNLLAMTMSSMVIVVFSILPYLGPWWLVAFGIFFSLSGGYSVIGIAAMCFISDVTDNDNRTFRLVMVQMISTIGAAAGSMISPYLLREVGIVYLFLIAACLYTSSYVFTILFIEESLPNATKGSILGVLDWSHIKEMITECFKKKPNNGRAKLLLLVSATTLTAFTGYGSSGLTYLYARNKLQWTMKDFTTFTSVSTVWGLGGFFAVAFFQKMFNVCDLTFAAITVLTFVGESVIKAGATTSFEMYLGSFVSFFGGVAGTLTRSFLAKTLPSQEIAKVFSLFGSTEAFCPLIAPLVYNALYAFTLSSFPGAFYVLSAAICGLSFVFIMIVKYLVRRSPAVSYQLLPEDAMIN